MKYRQRPNWNACLRLASRLPDGKWLRTKHEKQSSEGLIDQAYSGKINATYVTKFGSAEYRRWNGMDARENRVRKCVIILFMLARGQATSEGLESLWLATYTLAFRDTHQASHRKMGPIVRSLRLDLVGGVGLTHFVKSQESCRHCHSSSGEHEKTNTKEAVSVSATTKSKSSGS